MSPTFKVFTSLVKRFVPPYICLIILYATIAYVYMCNVVYCLLQN